MAKSYSIWLFSSLLLTSGLLSACGSSSDSDDQAADVVASFERDPALYYLWIDHCDELNAASSLSYNAKGKLVREKTCVLDEAAGVLKVMERTINGTDLKVNSYTEITFNEFRRPTAAKEWRDVEKTDLVYDMKITYADDGKLKQAIKLRDDNKVEETTDFDDLERPAKETIVTKGPSKVSVVISDCLFFRGDSPCQKTRDGEVEESVVQEGDDFVEKSLVQGKLVETHRYSFLFGETGPYKRSVSKSYTTPDEISYETEENCSYDGESVISCTEVKRSKSGTVFSTHNSKLTKYGRVRIKIGANETVSDTFGTTSGDFAVTNNTKEYTGSYTRTLDTATFNEEDQVTLDLKTITPTNTAEDNYGYIPYWLPTGNNVEDLFSGSTTTGSLTLKAVRRYNANLQDVLREITDVTGVDLEQIDETFVMKRITTY